MHFVRKLHVVQLFELPSFPLLSVVSKNLKPFCHLHILEKKFHVVTHLFSPLSCMASFIALTTAKDKVDCGILTGNHEGVCFHFVVVVRLEKWMFRKSEDRFAVVQK